MKKVSFVLILLLTGCTYWSQGTITLKASKVKDVSGIISGEDPKLLHSWERCAGFNCDKVLKQRRKK